MIEELLDMRFKDDDARLRVQNADTNRKKALAWQFFANRLSEKLEVVLSSDQVANKYKILKCEYRQGKEARTDTGNNGNEDESEIWGILNSAFAGRTGIGGATLADADNDSDCVEKRKVFLILGQPPKSGYIHCTSGCCHERRHDSYRRIDGD